MFKHARLKLTLWYLLILMSVTIFFSLIIHQLFLVQVKSFVKEQRFRIERRYGFVQPSEPWDVEFIEAADRRATLTLLLINGGIFLVAGSLGYFLAGQTLKPIQIMVDEQNRFVTDSSHELRTPLTSLKTATEVALRDKKLSVAIARAVLKDNLGDINRLGTLSSNLLRLAQFSLVDKKPIFSKISTRKIIQKALQHVNHLAKSKDISIINHAPNYFLFGSEPDLVDLLAILLDNALKYSRSGASIEIDSKKTSTSLSLSVSDHGCGIAEKDLPHLFERFFRSDQSRTATDGFGLGLSIAKRITEAHRGTLKVTTEPNSGSTFVVELPLSKPV
jgi:hypothetical protein